MRISRSFPFLVALTLAAATYDPKLFSGLQWRSIGPLRGGRSITSSGSPSRPLEYYFGATGGGLWKTTDGGLTWRPVTDGQLTSSSVGAVAVAPSNPDVVYIGMGETELRGNIMQGDGVYKTTDAGRTWKHIGLADTQAISRVRVHPTNPDIVYVAALGHPFGPNTERGVFRSRDGGQHWDKVLYKDDHAGAVDLCMDPSDPNTLYAAIWDVYRTPWSLSSGGARTGLYKTTDGGDHWTEITRNPGLPKGIDGKIGVSVSGADSKRIYAIVENENGGLFSSDDAGATWKLASDNRDIRQRAFYYSRVIADPKARDTVYVLNVNFHKSTDGGKTFRQLRPPHGDNHDLWIDPANPQRMIESNDGGAAVSVNGGLTWTNEQYPTAQLYHVAVTKEIPYHVCGAQQDSSTICVTSAGGGRGGRASGLSNYDVGGGESGYIAPDPKNPNIFFAGSQGALLTRFDRRTGYSKDVQVYPLFFSGENAGSLPERWQWTYPIVFSPVNPEVLYTSSQHLWKTVDDGHSWTMISPDLTRHDPKTLGDSGGPITHDQNGPEIYATIFSIAPSRKDEKTIWTGSDDGLVFITRDGGGKEMSHWQNVTPPGMPKFGRVSLIEASPYNAGTAYVAAKNYQNDDRKPYLFKTGDYGKTWTKIVNGIGENDFVQAVREDPVKPGLLFAGTEHGIYVSFDNGAEWQSLRQNLPDTQVSDLLIEGNDLVIATHGRSFYVMDDITPLRQMNAALVSENVHLFSPAPAIRNVNTARIDYFLDKPAEKVQIDILDGSGKVIRTFTGTPADQNAGRGGRGGRGAAEEEGAAGEEAASGGGGRGGRGGGNAAPPDKAGLNRFTWDLRYPGAKTFEGMILWGGNTNGPVAVPGSYQVRLTAGGKTQTQRFTLEKDPRLDSVTIADLKAQFDLSMKILNDVTRADEIVIAIRDLKKQMEERQKAKPDPSIKAACEALLAKLTPIEEDVYQVRNRSNQDPLNFPIKLNNKIAALGSSVQHGDGKPTAASYEVYDLLHKQLVDEQNKFNTTVKLELPKVNAILVRNGLKELVVQ
ncbi:MAG TPA: hypothetical protein VN736_23340 [Candidatus Limnocylindrales bacterium]|nr:hypothetical protein [Candidatus Limnocylindrales bacterium]